MDNEERVNYLLNQINNGQATAMECEELWQLMANDPSGSLLEKANRFFNENAASSAPAMPTVYWQQAIRRILGVDTMQQERNEQGTASVIPVRRGHFLKTAWYWYAAAVMIMLGTGAYFWLAHKKNTTPAALVTIPDVAPGHDGAILTLADGTNMVLDSMGNGIIANQHGVRVVLKDGQLVYDPARTSSDSIFYNTMSTSNGRQFHVQLPDGTQVWLNSASSIRYPTVFAGNERKVEITGEVYFEVAKDAATPFVVNVNDQADIQVLGTHFNVKAYDNEEAIKITLLEGKVKVVNRQSSIVNNRESSIGNRQSVVLKPGQQAVLTHDSRLTIDVAADTSAAMAWKNGLFNFNGYDLKSAMREIARWYNLEVIYEEEPEARELMGKIQRNLTLNQVMNIIRDIDVHYRLEGRRLIIMK